MSTIRHFFGERPEFAALLLATALFLKALVPAGYMPATPETGLIVALCSGATATGTTVTITIPKKGSDQNHGSTVAEHPCAFAPLSSAMTGADLAPLVLAALAFAFVAAIVRKPLALLSVAAHIRPPSQGPPRFT